MKTLVEVVLMHMCICIVWRKDYKHHSIMNVFSYI